MNTTAATNRRTEFLEAAKAHYAADMLVKQTYGRGNADDFKGCSVGCFLHNIYPTKTGYEIDALSSKHSLVAKHYGYPEWLALLQDTVFEGLPNGESAKWHVELAERIAVLPEDYDWQSALHRVHVGILRVSFQTAGTAQEVVQRAIELHERAGRGESINNELWSAAESAARSAARSAAGLAARSAARSAAYQEIRDAILSALSPAA